MFDFIRYLDAKFAIDDRALFRPAYTAFLAGLRSQPDPVRVFEIGGGSGSMLRRLSAEKLLHRLNYVLCDSEHEQTQAVSRRYPHIETLTGDFLQLPLQQRYQAVIAHAVLDILPIDTALKRCRQLLEPDGVLYAPILFNGITRFAPQGDSVAERDLDAAILEEYHLSMDERLLNGVPSGSRYSGQLVLDCADKHNFRVAVTGSSDWHVQPVSSHYRGDEQYFLFCILAMLQQSVSQRIRTGKAGISSQDLTDWLSRRRQQLTENTLQLNVHNIDCLLTALPDGATHN